MTNYIIKEPISPVPLFNKYVETYPIILEKAN